MKRFIETHPITTVYLVVIVLLAALIGLLETIGAIASLDSLL